MARWPYPFLEIHPEDAKARGIESGDLVSVESDRVYVQTGGYIGVEEDDLTFTKLMESGNIKVNAGSFTCVAIVTDAVRRGVAFNYFNWPESPGNAIVSRVPDPITNRYRFKLTSARVRRIGESPFKHSLTTMSFAPRHVT